MLKFKFSQMAPFRPTGPMEVCRYFSSRLRHCKRPPTALRLLRSSPLTSDRHGEIPVVKQHKSQRTRPEICFKSYLGSAYSPKAVLMDATQEIWGHIFHA
jgi:hypothetical protein